MLDPNATFLQDTTPIFPAKLGPHLAFCHQFAVCPWASLSLPRLSFLICKVRLLDWMTLKILRCPDAVHGPQCPSRSLPPLL